VDQIGSNLVMVKYLNHRFIRKRRSRCPTGHPFSLAFHERDVVLLPSKKTVKCNGSCGRDISASRGSHNYSMPRLKAAQSGAGANRRFLGTVSVSCLLRTGTCIAPCRPSPISSFAAPEPFLAFPRMGTMKSEFMNLLMFFERTLFSKKLAWPFGRVL
jgi:hypothetical protein